MRKNLEREIAAAALGSGDGTEAVRLLLMKGLHAFREARLGLREAGLFEAMLRKSGRDYVRIGLPRGASVRLHLPAHGQTRLGGSTSMPLLTLFKRNEQGTPYMEPSRGAKELARRVGTNIEVILRVVLGIERARRKLYALCEEETRWL